MMLRSLACTAALLLAAPAALRLSPQVAASSVEAIGSDTFLSDDSHFSGWRGTLPDLRHGTPRSHRGQVAQGGARGKTVPTLSQEWKGQAKQLAWSPRAFLFKGFLSDEECDHLVNKARARLERSMVVDDDQGGSKLDNVRTSSGTFLNFHEDPVVARIEERISRVTYLPQENGEGLQVLRYQKGQEYRPHLDAFADKINADPQHGGQRAATMLMYLTTPEEGGETVFPQGRPRSSGPGWSDCAKQGLSVKATKGNAVLFYSMHPNGTVDPHSEHGSCPTTKGEKWSAPKWIHESSLKGDAATSVVACADVHTNCRSWAAKGECKSNPGFMLSRCRKSCCTCAGESATDPEGVAENQGAEVGASVEE